MRGKDLEPAPKTPPGAPRRGAPTVLDLFSGIGGFALAFEAAGFQTVAFSEIEPYPCKVLAQHWPQVPNLGDVRAINGEDYRGAVDVVCGGFPCQDISTAGKGAGIHGERSGLWFEMLRIIRGARPAFCLLENVPALRSRGADVVLEGLEEAGYAARPYVVGVGNAGAPHQRARVWVVAYTKGESLGAPRQSREPQGLGTDNDSQGPQDVSWSPAAARPYWRPQPDNGNWWATEPAMGRVVHGVPNRAHRIKALGNSIVPAVAYPFAQWIYGVLKARSATETKAKGSNP